MLPVEQASVCGTWFVNGMAPASVPVDCVAYLSVAVACFLHMQLRPYPERVWRSHWCVILLHSKRLVPEG